MRLNLPNLHRTPSILSIPSIPTIRHPLPDAAIANIVLRLIERDRARL
jgi:hypothetical protein